MTDLVQLWGILSELPSMHRTYPHDVNFDDSPWWSTTLSLGGAQFYEVFVNTPTDATYLYALSLGIFEQNSSHPGCINPVACNFDSEALYG